MCITLVSSSKLYIKFRFLPHWEQTFLHCEYQTVLFNEIIGGGFENPMKHQYTAWGECGDFLMLQQATLGSEWLIVNKIKFLVQITVTTLGVINVVKIF